MSALVNVAAGRGVRGGMLRAAERFRRGAQAATLGAMIFSYFNDSLFWVVNRMLGVKEVKHQLLTWSMPTTVAWATSLVAILVADIFM